VTLAQKKIFVMERSVSFHAGADGAFIDEKLSSVRNDLSSTFFRKFARRRIARRALKSRFEGRAIPHFLRMFKQERNKAFAAVWPGRSPRL